MYYRVLVSIAFTYLSFRELLMLAERLQASFGKFFLEDPFISNQVQKLAAAIVRLTRAFQAGRGSKYTEILARKDNNRDAAFQSLASILEGLAGLKVDAVIAASAKELLSILEKHGRTLHRFGYTKQSASLKALLEEYSQPEYQKMFEETGTTRYLNILLDAHNDFEATVSEKMDDEGVKNYPDAKESADEIIYRLSSILKVADTLSFDQSDMYKQASGEINAVINEIMIPARSRETRKGNVSEEQGVTETPTQSDTAGNLDAAPGIA